MNLTFVKSASSALFGAATLGMVEVLTGSIDLGSTTYSIGDQAPIAAFLALVLAAGIHGPRLKQMAIWELILGIGAVALPVLVFVGEPVALTEMFGTASEYHPWTSLGLALLAYGGFWVLSWR
jgi:hypothetical protein